MQMHRDVPGVRYCSVFLDGAKLTYCLVADDAEDWALCALEGADGRLAYDVDYVEGVRTEFRYGTVTFTFDKPEERQKAERYWAEQAGGG